ncbi:helix-turn-helix domain-containing protein [Anaerosacchariphilus polymeriproducens]|uniref:XRE family transcriptional regulator n=1 Tax=Anaerosacchariphilus polymeriproducens TaxID=1812858 RepID=A0A371AZ79_9FIRM|nr:helix-turn-helix transcriptional regulator [Anaerosacchariphilus polymeriproducens]RDU24908.1 XRE family transcriptional regulator [Anaerosacchariphilus polymeriproducens]
MTIMELLKEKGLSRYSLSKISGIPWATLADICSGKTSLNRCNVQTLSKLSRALNISMEEIFELETKPQKVEKSGKPADKTYLETNLSLQLTKAIKDYEQGDKDKVSYMDCLWGELYGSINADFWAGCISEEQANYLRKKYLYSEEQEGSDD